MWNRAETTLDTRSWWTAWSTTFTSYPAVYSTKRPLRSSVRLLWPSFSLLELGLSVALCCRDHTVPFPMFCNMLSTRVTCATSDKHGTGSVLLCLYWETPSCSSSNGGAGALRMRCKTGGGFKKKKIISDKNSYTHRTWGGISNE